MSFQHLQSVFSIFIILSHCSVPRYQVKLLELNPCFGLHLWWLQYLTRMMTACLMHCLSEGWDQSPYLTWPSLHPAGQRWAPDSGSPERFGSVCWWIGRANETPQHLELDTWKNSEICFCDYICPTEFSFRFHPLSHLGVTCLWPLATWKSVTQFPNGRAEANSSSKRATWNPSRWARKLFAFVEPLKIEFQSIVFPHSLSIQGDPKNQNGRGSTESGLANTRHPVPKSHICATFWFFPIAMWALLTWEVTGANGCFKQMFPKAAEQVHCQREIDAPWLSLRIWMCDSKFVWAEAPSICISGLEQDDKALWFRDEGCKYIPNYWPYECGAWWSSTNDVHYVLPSEHGCIFTWFHL